MTRSIAESSGISIKKYSEVILISGSSGSCVVGQTRMPQRGGEVVEFIA
jgi:hypothetical protein